MKTDERALLLAVYAGKVPRHAGADLRIPPERVVYLCGKWDDKGWYDYGVSVDLGWLTPSGIDAARKL